MDWHLFFQSLSDNDHGSQDEPLLPHSSILLTPFAIKDDIHVGGVHISRSESVLLAGASSIAYLSSVATTSFSLPGWLDTQPFCHPLAQALAISLTFITGHKCGYAINIPNHIFKHNVELFKRSESSNMEGITGRSSLYKTLKHSKITNVT